jgi:hypothetical protein
MERATCSPDSRFLVSADLQGFARVSAVKFQFLKAASMNTVFWVIARRSPVEVHWRLRGACACHKGGEGLPRNEREHSLLDLRLFVQTSFAKFLSVWNAQECLIYGFLVEEFCCDSQCFDGFKLQVVGSLVLGVITVLGVVTLWVYSRFSWGSLAMGRRQRQASTSPR